MGAPALKTHRSAVVAIPPREVWEPVQALRRRHDPQMARWMPHVTLLYPFRPERLFAAAQPRLAAACARIAPFDVTLREPRCFAHRGERFTLWLAPEPADPWDRLQAALQAAFPDCDDVARFAAGFTPHLSVGRVRGRGALARVLDELRAGWRPLPFRLDAVSLIARPEDGPFAEVARFPLG